MAYSKEVTRKAAALLRRSRARIAKPGTWTKRHNAQDSQGHGCFPDADRACSWCATGTVHREGLDSRENWCAIKLLQLVVPTGWSPRTIVEFNDDPETTHPDILALFDRAIAAAEKEGA